jgi:hypothetical protein
MGGMKESTEFYDLILLAPGMDEPVKLDSRISCRTALFLVIALEYGVTSADAANPLKKILSEEDQGILKALAGEVLSRAKLQAFYEKLRKLS